MPGASRRRQLWLRVAAAVLLLALLEAGAYVLEIASGRFLVEPIRRRAVILREQSERIEITLDSSRVSREMLDSALGWRYRAGFTSVTDNLNAQGVRGRRSYDAVAPAGILRVAAFGDSFVYGNEVRDDAAWTAFLQSEGTGLEVLNYGVGGYGLDQAFLRFRREGTRLEPAVVLIGFSPDDLRRIENVYRRFISSLEWPLGKPRFLLAPDSTLVLVPNPLRGRDDYRALLANPRSVGALGQHDAWYSPTVYEHPLYDALASLRVGHAVWLRLNRRFFDDNRLAEGEVFNARSSAFALQTVVLRAFADSVKATRAIPVVLMLPDRRTVDATRAGHRPAYAPLHRALAAHGIAVWDGAEPFRSVPEPISEHFLPGGHYSPLGNRALANWLRVRIDSLRGQSDP